MPFIAGTLGATEGKGVFRDISQFHPTFNEAECDRTFDSLVSNSYGSCIGVLLNACTRAGVPHLTELLQ